MSEEAARRQAAVVYGAATPLIQQYVDILSGRGLAWGLLGPREGERVWSRHIMNSAALGQRVPAQARVIDVGSGAGLPGLPLAILRPDVLVTLLEPLQRRAAFLELAVDELGLGERVRVLRGRAEEHRQGYDVVTCRAVAALPRLLGWTTALFDGSADGVPGRLVALKGQSAAAEIAAAAGVLRAARLTAAVHEVRAHPEADPTFALEVTPLPR